MRRTASGRALALQIDEHTPMMMQTTSSATSGGNLIATTSGPSTSIDNVVVSTQHHQDEGTVLSVFWCGTAGTIAERTTQISLFSRLCDAVALDPSARDPLRAAPTRPS